MVRFGDLHRGIRERAATRLLATGLLHQQSEQRLDLRPRVPGVCRDRRVPPLPRFGLRLTQVLRHELVLGDEVAVEAHFVGAGPAGDGIHADGADATGIEQIVGGSHDAIADALPRPSTHNLWFYSRLTVSRSIHDKSPLDRLLTGH